MLLSAVLVLLPQYFFTYNLQAMKNDRNEIYTRITTQILSNLQAAGSWQKLWSVSPPISLNAHVYAGVNHLLLSLQNFSTPVWGTFLQIRKNGGCIKKGEKASLVVFWKRSTYLKVDSESGAMSDTPFFLLRFYQVFNADQVIFDPMGAMKVQELSGASQGLKNSRSVPAERIIALMENPPELCLGSFPEACYMPEMDLIRMPDIKYFKNSDPYYSTLFHELIHCTGHKSRLGRFSEDQFDNKETYSKEELVAELGSAYLSEIAGIRHNIENSRAYIKSWLKVLSDNPGWIVWAASRAQKACEHIVPDRAKNEPIEDTINTL